MSMFDVKKIIAGALELIRMNDLMIRLLNRRYNNNYIRVVNYHSVESYYRENFESQLMWYKRNFVNIDENSFISFMAGNLILKNKPGIMLTFDDGFHNNYNTAYPVMKEYGFTGYYMISSDLIGKEGYMNWNELSEISANGGVIGCHTASHHRMNKEDSESTLKEEIYYSKKKIESKLNLKCKIFCWVGGEEEHYTKRAADIIKKSQYDYSFMTCSSPLLPSTDPLKIQRINVEAYWPISLVKFQLSGVMDKRFAKKKNRVEELTG